jgi:hypothetical protein
LSIFFANDLRQSILRCVLEPRFLKQNPLVNPELLTAKSAARLFVGAAMTIQLAFPGNMN